MNANFMQFSEQMRLLDTQEVTGSTPVSPTCKNKGYPKFTVGILVDFGVFLYMDMRGKGLEGEENFLIL